MNELKLKALKLNVKDLLSKEEMKKINGGTGCLPIQCTNIVNGYVGNCALNMGECSCHFPNGQWVVSSVCFQ